MTTSSLIISPMLVISKTISIKKTPTEACNKVCKAKFHGNILHQPYMA